MQAGPNRRATLVDEVSAHGNHRRSDRRAVGTFHGRVRQEYAAGAGLRQG